MKRLNQDYQDSRIFRICVAVGLVLALAFTFSCGEVEPLDEEVVSISSSQNTQSSSSNVGGTSSSDVYVSSSSEREVVSSSSVEEPSPSSSSFAPSSSSSAPNSEEFTGGSCNASDYGTVRIGDQTWMKKNWGCYAPGSKCYDNNPANCTTYGRLYDWEAALTACPSGWHLPSNADWDKLLKFVDNANGGSGVEGSCPPGTCYSSETAGRYLKARSSWNEGGNGEDAYGFSALSGGGFSSSDGSFKYVGSSGRWWSSAEHDSYYSDAYIRIMIYTSENARWDYYDKSDLFSVRCLQD